MFTAGGLDKELAVHMCEKMHVCAFFTGRDVVCACIPIVCNHNNMHAMRPCGGKPKCYKHIMALLRVTRARYTRNEKSIITTPYYIMFDC